MASIQNEQQEQRYKFDTKLRVLEEYLGVLEKKKDTIKNRGVPSNLFVYWIDQFNQIENNELKDEIGYLDNSQFEKLRELFNKFVRLVETIECNTETEPGCSMVKKKVRIKVNQHPNMVALEGSTLARLAFQRLTKKQQRYVTANLMMPTSLYTGSKARGTGATKKHARRGRHTKRDRHAKRGRHTKRDRRRAGRRPRRRSPPS